MFLRLIFFLNLLNALPASNKQQAFIVVILETFPSECITVSMPDSSLAHVCSVLAARMMSSFNNLVIVLLMIGIGIHQHLLAQCHCLPFFGGTSLYARRVDM